MGVVFMTTGYNPYVFTQTQEFLLGLRWLIAGLPILALLLALLIIYFYPLTGRKLDEMDAQVAKMHVKKGVT